MPTHLPPSTTILRILSSSWCMSDAPLSPSFQQTMEDEEMQHAMEDWSSW
ncbi:hypothetical protein T4E_7359 [Trichinella pseudospiralis]|uniref:Uncharacterized protein n=1 Tax=Trichinella pseudospiralis TaxID=6337 RepID=A0A0V0WA93_TRIPS|nr:hypothetical protein T4E_7359 [Trichinella pseudospiralis]